MTTTVDFQAPCPQCGKDATWIAHPTAPYGFDIKCSCFKRRKK